MKIIGVTGATGFVGGFISGYLEARGYQVIRFGRKERENIIRWDIAKAPYEKELTLDAIVHCAASVDDWARYEDSYATNVIGTRNVLASFPDVPTFIYISSGSVYDPFCRTAVISEEMCMGGRPLNAYSATKLLGEKEVLSSSIPSKIVLRPHIIYGPGDATVGPRFKRATRSGYFFVPGNGKNRISFTHVENLALAVEASLALSKVGGSIYNITDAEPVMLEEALAAVRTLNHMHFKEVHIPRALCFAIGGIAEGIYSLTGAKHAPLLTRYLVQQMASDHVLDISKAQEELKYHPTKTVKNDLFL
jgi:nucleoside-diphosphate-sugar epimerase